MKKIQFEHAKGFEAEVLNLITQEMLDGEKGPAISLAFRLAPETLEDLARRGEDDEIDYRKFSEPNLSWVAIQGEVIGDPIKLGILLKYAIQTSPSIFYLLKSVIDAYEKAFGPPELTEDIVDTEQLRTFIPLLMTDAPAPTSEKESKAEAKAEAEPGDNNSNNDIPVEDLESLLPPITDLIEDMKFIQQYIENAIEYGGVFKYLDSIDDPVQAIKIFNRFNRILEMFKK